MEVHTGNANSEKIKIGRIVKLVFGPAADESIRKSDEHNHFPNQEDVIFVYFEISAHTH